MFIESDMFFFICVVKISMCEENYIITQQNSNLNNVFGNLNNQCISITTQTLLFSGGNASYSRNLSDTFSSVTFTAVMGVAINVPIVCTLTQGAIDNYTIRISGDNINGDIQVRIMYVGVKKN